MSTFASWKGFEISPRGCLLEQVIDLSTEMGLAYERSCTFYKEFHTHDRLMLTLPRASSVMEVRTLDPKETFRFTQKHLLLVPPHLEHDDEGISSIYDTLALYPTEDFVRRTAKQQGVADRILDPLCRTCLKLKRSDWFEQLVNRYFFIRVIGKAKETEETAFFEQQILCEMFRMLGNEREHSTVLPQDEASIATRALRFIETNLFDDLSLKRIAKHAGTSIPTLLRHFRAETRQTPYAYIKDRRLEEAKLLLTSGNHSVGEVALLVGYENFGSFSEAFKAKFRRAPSALVKA